MTFAVPFRVSAVLFDLDGTLVDSAPDLRTVLNRMLAQLGLRAVSLDEVKAMIGDGAPVLLERALRVTGGPVARREALMPEFLAIYQETTSRETRPYPGVVETLERLAAAGFALAVVTNKPSRAATAVLDELGLARFFPAVVGGDTLPRRKPDPAPLRHALGLLGVAAEDAVMVGDNHHDVSAARAAGVAAIAVTYGYSHKPHAELGADRLVDDFREIAALVERRHVP